MFDIGAEYCFFYLEGDNDRGILLDLDDQYFKVKLVSYKCLPIRFIPKSTIRYITPCQTDKK